MSTVFSHIVQKHLSQSYENVATDALAFILSTTPDAQAGLMRLLRDIAPELPDLTFKTQLTEDTARPDMWGVHAERAHVFVENKFWAGLTENQPVRYLNILTDSDPKGILLFVAPKERCIALWRELTRRLDLAGISVEQLPKTGGLVCAARTSPGPVVALASWDGVLSMIEAAVADDPRGTDNVNQLRSLCATANENAFTPISPFETSDQRMPAFILQLGRIVQEASAEAASQGHIRVDGLRPSATWDCIGRYVKFASSAGYDGGFGAFFGIDFKAWRTHGLTPLWVCFSAESQDRDWRRAEDARAAIQQGASGSNVFSSMESREFVVGIEVSTGEEMQAVKQKVVDQLRFIAKCLARIPTA
jgi:hypothetical protein